MFRPQMLEEIRSGIGNARVAGLPPIFEVLLVGLEKVIHASLLDTDLCGHNRLAAEIILHATGHKAFPRRLELMFRGQYCLEARAGPPVRHLLVGKYVFSVRGKMTVLIVEIPLAIHEPTIL